METTRTSYSMEEKKEMIIDILSRKTTIQKLSREKGIAATLISLWKKQAMEAMEARFRPQPKGRPKNAPEPVSSVMTAAKESRNAARSAKIKAKHLEKSLHDTREKLAHVEEQLQALAATLGYTLVKERKQRKPRKPRKA